MIGLAVTAALWVVAQDPSWTANPPPRIPGSMQLTLQRYRYFVNCSATRNWDQARPLFDTPIGSMEEEQALARVSGRGRGTECSYADYMRMTSSLMRGGIAEARYRHVCARDRIPPPNPEDAPVPEGASFAWAGFNRDSAPQLLFNLAVCLAERETGSVHAVLMTEFGSRSEREAFQALSRRFGACLAPGQRLRANSLTFRPWLGEALYQFSRARRPDVSD